VRRGSRLHRFGLTTWSRTSRLAPSSAPKLGRRPTPAGVTRPPRLFLSSRLSTHPSSPSARVREIANSHLVSRRDSRGRRLWALKLDRRLSDKCVLMSKTGRQRVATDEECTRVRMLAAEGVSLRRIAEEVFGDRRLRGRVERILQATEMSRGSGVPVTEVMASLETLPTVRVALARYLARVAGGEVSPSVGEMVKLLDLERRLQALEALDEIKALTRAVDQPLDQR
jgi:hypothetical protein